MKKEGEREQNYDEVVMMRILEYYGNLICNVNYWELCRNEWGLQLHQLRVSLLFVSYTHQIYSFSGCSVEVWRSAEDVSQLLPLSNLSSVTRNALPIIPSSPACTLHPLKSK